MYEQVSCDDGSACIPASYVCDGSSEYGNASWGFNDTAGFTLENPKSTGYTGDIRITASAATTIMLKLKKVEGYTNSK